VAALAATIVWADQLGLNFGSLTVFKGDVHWRHFYHGPQRRGDGLSKMLFSQRLSSSAGVVDAATQRFLSVCVRADTQSTLK
jgi:hypothetical protein